MGAECLEQHRFQFRESSFRRAGEVQTHNGAAARDYRIHVSKGHSETQIAKRVAGTRQIDRKPKEHRAAAGRLEFLSAMRSHRRRKNYTERKTTSSISDVAQFTSKAGDLSDGWFELARKVQPV